MIIRNRRKVDLAQTAPVSTLEAEMDDVLLQGLCEPQSAVLPNPGPDQQSDPDLEPEPEPVPETAATPAANAPTETSANQDASQDAPVKKRGRGRPPHQRTEVISLPDGMTDPMLAWACGVNPSSNSVYRWRTGQVPLPDTADVMMRMWEEVGVDKFVELVTKIRGIEPPADVLRRKFQREASVEQYIDGILKSRGGMASLAEIHEALRTEHQHEITLRSLKTMLSRLKGRGVVTLLEGRMWSLPEKTKQELCVEQRLLEILGGRNLSTSVAEMQKVLSVRFGHNVNLRTLKTVLKKMKQDGLVVSDKSDFWNLAKQ